MKDAFQNYQYMNWLARLMIGSWLQRVSDGMLRVDDAEVLARRFAGLGSEARTHLLKLADAHHVTVRSLSIVEAVASEHGESSLSAWCEETLDVENVRIQRAVRMLEAICRGLEAQGCPVTVIKSLDHWPDLGSDLDLFTTAHHRMVERVMRSQFDAAPVARSWGDRLAGKWNFQVPGLPELVEIHVQQLGQTGEHRRMAQRIIDRRVRKDIGRIAFYVPAVEERILISVLQRIYRHFYFRLCDMVEVGEWLRADAVDFRELRRGAEVGGIWPGVATFLCIVRNFVESYGGSVPLSGEVTSSAFWPDLRVRFANGFLRVPKFPAAGLYGAQLVRAGMRFDLRALSRLPLLPPLAVSALVAYHLSGDDKGIW